MAKSEDGLGLLLLGGKPKGEKGSGSHDDDDDAKTVAAKGLIKALKSENPARVVAAFEEMLACCDDTEYSDKATEDDSEE